MRTATSYLALLLLAVFLAASTTACGDKPSKGQCEKLLDHMIEIEINSAGTDQLSDEMKADVDKQKKLLHDHLKKAFMDQCVKKTPGSYVECGLKARNLEELAKCDKK